MVTADRTLNMKVGTSAPQERIGQRFDWMVIVTLAWFLGGAYLDSWAHNHLAEELETFFTPWHAVLYSGFAASAAVHVGRLYRNVSQGWRFTQAVPKGYLLSLVGIAIFFVGGVGDMLWHELFGIEVGVEGMISPTHLLLIAGATLVYSGPLRAAWQRRERANLWPAMLSLFLVYSLFTLVGQFANLTTDPGLIVRAYPASMVDMADFLGVSSVLIPAALMIGMILLAVRRWWTLPLGSLTVMLGGNAVIMFLTRYREVAEYPIVLATAVAGGLAADALLHWLRPSPERAWAFRMFAFVVPLVYYLLFFAGIISLHGIRWSIHVWLGVTVLAGMMGLLLSLAALPPRIPGDATEPASS